MKTRFLLAAVSMLAIAGTADAQNLGGAARNYIGVGGAIAPDYPGSNDMRGLPFAAIRARVGGVSIVTQEPGVAVKFNPDDRFVYGAFLRHYRGRDNDIEDPVVKLLAERDSSLVGGVLAEYRIARGVLTQYDQLSIDGRLGADTLGEFDGLVWSTNLSYGLALSPRLFSSISLGISGFSDDYADRLFSVDAADAVASGLQQFQAEGGIRDIGTTFIADYRFSENWSVSMVANYSRLLNDFADSPVVSDRGSENQGFLGVALGRRF